MALKESSLREERLWPSAQKIKAGEGSRAAHAELVNAIKPVRPYAEPVPPASDDEVQDALSKDKKPNAFAPRAIPEQTPVAVRLDIPAYEQRNTWVVSVHHPKSDFTAGPVIGYDSVAHIDNPRFGVHPTGALNIASGKPKSTIATVHGNWRNITPEDAFDMAKHVHRDPEWRQVGMDPERHSYFYDRETQRPIIAAEEALHIGPLVYAKNPVYDNPESYKFSDGGAAGYIPHNDPRRAQNLNDFHGTTPKEIKEARWYHGTDKNFSSFRPDKADAIFLTKNPSFAHKFATKDYNVDNVSPNIMPVHVRAENPFDCDNYEHLKKLNNLLMNYMDDDHEISSILRDVKEGNWETIEKPIVQEAFKELGHDSFFVYEGGNKNLAVYNSSQIKSATGNQGTFDQSNPDITKADGGALTDDEGITAYHGSPHDFERFDTSKIGTGEGAQAYGHGLYFAQNEDVAKSYRDNLVQTRNPIQSTNDLIGQMSKNSPASRTRENVKWYMKQDPMLSPHIEDNEVVGHILEALNGQNADGSVSESALDAYGKLTNKFGRNDKGHMYEVHINAHPDHFLDWDEVLEDQNPHIKAALQRVADHDDAEKGYTDLHEHLADPDAYTGGAFYQTFAGRGRAKEASEILSQMGIKGIRYKDAGSRFKNEKLSYNYVVFNHDHVKVRRKYERGGAV